MDADKQLQQNIVPGESRPAKWHNKPQFKFTQDWPAKKHHSVRTADLSGSTATNDEHTNGEQF